MSVWCTLYMAVGVVVGLLSAHRFIPREGVLLGGFASLCMLVLWPLLVLDWAARRCGR